MSTTKVISARIDEKILKEIDEVAASRNRKKNEIVEEALRIYLAEHAEYKIAMERFKDHTDKIISEAELLDNLSWND